MNKTELNTENPARYIEISVEGLQILGSGKNGDVYRIDKEKVVKIYRKNYGISKIHKEFLFASLCREAGIPAMIPYEIVQHGEAYGIIYEKLNGVSIKELLIGEPEKVETLAALHACFMRENHRITLTQDYGLSARGITTEWLEQIPIFSITERNAIQTALETIPDRMCLLHMDPLPANLLLLSPGHFAWIDLEDGRIGHPVYSLQNLFCPDFIGHVSGFSRHTTNVLRKYWEYFAQYYFEGTEKKRIPGILRGIRFIAYLRYIFLQWKNSGNTPLFRIQTGLLKETLFRDYIDGLDFYW